MECRLFEGLRGFGERRSSNVSRKVSIVASHGRELGDFGGSHRLCSRMRIWELPDQYILQPTDRSSTAQNLVIDRTSGELTTIGVLPSSCNDRIVHAEEVYGIVGVIRLLAGAYYLVITGRKEVGEYHGSLIFQVTAMKFLSCNQNLQDASADELAIFVQKRDEAHFLSLLKVVETTPGLYFSYDTDLTVNAQKTHGTDMKHLPLWKQAEQRFLWNHYLLEQLIDLKLEPFILPVIQGSFQTAQTTVKSKIVKLSIISRRCMKRVGTRMWRRGANREGFVANFVETEQVIEADGYIFSYAQIRGSIPLLWEQIADLTYKPKIEAVHLEEAPNVVERHFLDLRRRYGDVMVIDLINQQGSEGVLSIAFAKAMQNIVSDSIRYVPYDFHHICGNTNFERLSDLYKDIAESLSKQSYYLADSEGKLLQEQKGVVRTNCIDCLDRTNVTQSMLGRKALETQLRRIYVFEASETLDQHSDLDVKFQCLWADNGDDISIQYSGTQALKGDFVRYGRRTAFGLIQDGFNSVSRYYLNNFKDGIKQDAMDLAAGHYTVKRGSPSPFQLNGFESFAYLPVASALLVTGITMTTISIREGGEAYQYINGVLWAGLAAGMTALIRTNGRLFCSRPRLCQLQ